MRHGVPVRLTIVAVALACLALWAPAAGAARARILVTTPHAWQVLQRDEAGRADLVVRGRCIGIRGALTVSWGGRPAAVRCGGDGRFTARLRRVRAGRHTLVVRSALRPGVVCRRLLVGVGDVYVIAGQSNASGRSPHDFTYRGLALRASMFGNDDRWRELRDPVDSSAGQVDVVSIDRHAGGSVWPGVATALLAEEGVPVAFVPCAHGSTRIAAWDPGRPAPRPAGTLYSSMARRIAAAGGSARAVLWWQGERDARFLTPGPVYVAALQDLSGRLWRDFRTPIVVAQIGDYDSRYPGDGIDAVRLAQAGAWGTSHILPGPVLYDVDLSGGVHFVREADVAVAARRWAAAILRHVLGREAAVSPRLVSAELDGRDLVLTADRPLAPGAAPGGFVVADAAGEVPVASAGVEAGGVVRLTLAEAPTGPVTVSLGQGRSGAGAAVPVDPTGWRLPMEPFISRPVTVLP